MHLYSVHALQAPAKRDRYISVAVETNVSLINYADESFAWAAIEYFETITWFATKWYLLSQNRLLEYYTDEVGTVEDGKIKYIIALFTPVTVWDVTKKMKALSSRVFNLIIAIAISQQIFYVKGFVLQEVFYY